MTLPGNVAASLSKSDTQDSQGFFNGHVSCEKELFFDCFQMI